MAEQCGDESGGTWCYRERGHGGDHWGRDGSYWSDPQPPAERVVTGCGDCPFVYYSEQAAGWFCESDGREVGLFAPPVAPDWCPLRERPVTLRLEASRG